MSVPARITHWKGLSRRISGITGAWGTVVRQLPWGRSSHSQASQDSAFSWMSWVLTPGKGYSWGLLISRMAWHCMTLGTYVSWWLCDSQHPSFLHSLISCTISVPLYLFTLGLAFVSKLRAQGKTFSNLRAPGDVLEKTPWVIIGLTNFNQGISKGPPS